MQSFVINIINKGSWYPCLPGSHRSVTLAQHTTTSLWISEMEFSHYCHYIHSCFPTCSLKSVPSESQHIRIQSNLPLVVFLPTRHKKYRINGILKSNWEDISVLSYLQVISVIGFTAAMLTLNRETLINDINEGSVV